MARLGNVWGCLALIAFLIGPGVIAACIFGFALWILVSPIVIAAILLGIAALPIKRKITPQQWANDLEKHLVGTEGPYDWDDATSVTLADERLERLRSRLVPNFDMLDTSEKRDEFRQIVEALRRGEIP
jgi:hypothetical protein